MQHNTRPSPTGSCLLPIWSTSCSPPLRERWFATCIDLALRTRQDSLLETLLLTYPHDRPEYAELLAEAKSRHEQSHIIQRVMKRLGHVSAPGRSPEDEALDRESKRKVAGHNLFNAIRRNDINAVKALLARKANTARDGRPRGSVRDLHVTPQRDDVLGRMLGLDDELEGRTNNRPPSTVTESQRS